MAEGRLRPAWAEIDLAAVRANAATLRTLVAPSALWAVVKADGYGHGAPAVARAAVEGGASGLCVALVDEGVELREAGISAPILLLSEAPASSIDAAVVAGLTPTVCTIEGVKVLAAAARHHERAVGVHVKVDTGMHRMGADPDTALGVVAALGEEAALDVEGLWTHLAVADGGSDTDRRFTDLQLERFEAVVAAVTVAGSPPKILHTANTAAALTRADSRYDLVRCGIALYGCLPTGAVAQQMAADGVALSPVMTLRAEVAAVRRLAAGERPSYGRLRPLPHEATVATVPIGYADGLPRAALQGGLEVLIGGRRHPLAGAVTMDQVVVDCGAQEDVVPGDAVVLLGRQGDDEITATEWAERLGTISYEVLCSIGPRVPRLVVDHS